MIVPATIKQATQLDVAYSPRMAEALALWSSMYADRAPWLKKDTVYSLNLAATIASEVARMVTIEMAVELSGSSRATWLQAQLDKVLTVIRTQVEYGCAKGGLMFKPYVRSGGIAVDYVQADMFYPTAFDQNGDISGCIFVDQRSVGSYWYTRLEYHLYNSERREAYITNTAFRSQSKDYIGEPVGLGALAEWADLEPEATVQNIDRPLFAYFRFPMANNLEPGSPLGVSCFSRAVDLIRQADEQWSRFLWEFESGERAIFLDNMAFRKAEDGTPLIPGVASKLKRLFRTIDAQGAVDKNTFFQDWTPTLRQVDLLAGLNAMLRQVEFACGLTTGTFSEPNVETLTATEIKMSKQRTYATVTDSQKALRTALDQLLYVMDAWATMSKPLLVAKGAYQANYSFDDSVVADHDTQFLQDTQALGLKVLGKWEFRMRNYGETEEKARAAIAAIDAETPPPAPDPFANIGSGG